MTSITIILGGGGDRLWLEEVIASRPVGLKPMSDSIMNAPGLTQRASGAFSERLECAR